MQSTPQMALHMPQVHVCSQLLSENEQMKRKLKKLKQQNVELLRQINDYREKQRMDAMMKQFVTTRNMEVQTDPQRSMMSNLHQQFQLQQQKKNSTIQENEKLNKMMLMHNNLMRRYEKELKINVEHVETITTLNLKVNELEQKLKESQIHVHQLEAKQARKAKPTSSSSNIREKDGWTSSDEDTEISLLRRQVRNLKKETNKLSSERRKLKEELGGLDHGFFEEVEDLKFALQQSARLNQEYERSLRKLCTRFGIPYPCPESKVLGTN